MKLEEIRQQYPQYNSLSDGDLAFRLWNKTYKGQIPMGQFADSIGLSQPAFTEMVSVAEQSGYQPTERTFAEGFRPDASTPRAFLQGALLGGSDEAVGAIRGVAQKIAGAEQPVGSLVSQAIDDERAKLEQFRQVAPGEALATEIAGSIASPANLVGGGALTALRPAARGAIAAGTTGAAYGFLSGEGSARERAENAIEVAIPSALIGSGSQTLVNLAGRTGQRLSRAVERSNQDLSLDSLRDVKNLAYREVDQSGAVFSPLDMKSLYREAREIARDHNYVQEADTETYAALKVLRNQVDQELTIGQLDKIRQNLWKRYNATNGKETAIGDMIDAIDELVESVPETNELMRVARAANSRYKKAELLTDAFDRAARQTSSTGSGGNIVNKYRQAVTSILNNPKKAKWFSEDELSSMEQFVSGDLSQNALRLIGKLSPSGNGLMMALNIGAVAADPMLAAVTVAGAASKYAADRAGIKGAERLVEQVAGGRPPVQIPYRPGASMPSATLGAQLDRAREEE